MKSKDPVDKNSRKFLERKISTGRSSLLLIIVLTVVNFGFLLADSGTYFLFSASVPYYLTLFMKGVENNFVMGSWENGPITMICVAISVVVLVVYLLCWIFSKKGSGWMTAAMVLFIVDTVGLVVISFGLLEDPWSNIIDFVLHIWAVAELIMASNAARKLKTMPQEQPIANVADLSKTDPEVF